MEEANKKNLRKKIDALENEIRVTLGNKWSYKDCVILNSLHAFYTEFWKSNIYVDREGASRVIINSNPLGLIDVVTSGKILDYFVNKGILIETTKAQIDPLVPDKITYSRAVEKFTDLLGIL